jgi:hypothetical protein
MRRIYYSRTSVLELPRQIAADKHHTGDGDWLCAVASKRKKKNIFGGKKTWQT